MRLNLLQATFGRLDNRTLKLSPGLNVISGDNETGKSTWTAFIMAMLYGIDTRGRMKGGRLPAKIRFAPWSGKPMEGAAELEWQGRTLQLERTSQSGPMADLEVTDPDTGCKVPELCGPDCGRQLLGVEAGVYERSGLIRQQGPVVSADPNLERRLNGLVTAVSEDYAYADIDGGLKRLQNAICYNHTGLIPKLETELEQINADLAQTEELSRRQAELAAQVRSAEQELLELQAIRQGLEQLEQLALRARLEQSRQALSTAEEDLKLWRETCLQLPPEPVLDGFRENLEGLRSRTQALANEERLDPIVLPDPPTDSHFQGLSGEEAILRAEQDAQTVQYGFEDGSPSWKKLLSWLLPGILLLAGSYLVYHLVDGQTGWVLFLSLLGGGILCAALALIFLAFSLLRFRRRRNRAIRLLQDYGADSYGQILRQAAGYSKRQEQYQAELETARTRQEARTEQTLSLEAEREDLLARLSQLIPGCTDLGKAEVYLQEAARSRASLALAERNVQRCRSELQQRTEQLGALPERLEDLDRFRDYDPEQIRDRVNRCSDALVALRSERDRLQGALEQQGDPLALAARKETLEARMTGLQDRSRALALARTTLEQADAEVRARFAPLLCARTGELFGRLTEGRYDRVRLDRSMRVTVHPKGSSTDRPLSALSGGTVDQLYLALRLAICELLLPEAPIVLDDALVYFDDNRAKIALQVLRELSRSRQILLFTCQGREKRLLRELAAENPPAVS